MAGQLVLRTLKHVWQSLEPLNLPMAVLGGLALSVWDHVRATKDVDLLIAAPKSGTAAILSAVVKAGFKPKFDPPVRLLGEMGVAQLMYEVPGTFVEVQVDLLFADSEYHLEALKRRLTLTVPGLDIPTSVLSCEDLIVHKLYAGRILDLSDVSELLKGNKSSIDLAYVKKWINHFSLRTQFSECWIKAFDGEKPPF